MAVYKVPQDVEAEDKLLGPFSFKQFIFLIIAVAALGMAYGLSQIFLPLALVPLPIALLFGAIALPLRKDQPTEVYLAALISFMTKPKIRMWKPDGIDRLFEVVAPVTDEKQYGKGYGQEEVQRRLSYLANLVDSQGWSVRGVVPNSSMQQDLYNEAVIADDVLDEDNATARNIDNLINQASAKRRQDMVNMLQQKHSSPAQQTNTAAEPAQNLATAQNNTVVDQTALNTPKIPEETVLNFSPYPNMHQSVLAPIDSNAPRSAPPQPTTQAPPRPAQTASPAPQPTTQAGANTTSTTQPSPAIIDLANNHSDLSVETLQREANRIRQKELDEGEVVISLR